MLRLSIYSTTASISRATEALPQVEGSKAKYAASTPDRWKENGRFVLPGRLRTWIGMQPIDCSSDLWSAVDFCPQVILHDVGFKLLVGNLPPDYNLRVMSAEMFYRHLPQLYFDVRRRVLRGIQFRNEEHP